MTAPIIFNCEQRSAEWIQARVGKVTSSRVVDVLAKIGKGEAAKRMHYRAELIAETLTGNPVQKYVTPEMQWGADKEPLGRAAYELQMEVMVSTVGFVVHPFIDRFGASPDGFVGDDGMVEVKCPTTATHLEWLLAGIVPAEHEPQMFTAMACSGRQWCDFVSFDPRLPAHLQLFIRRLYRDETRIADIEGHVVKFISEVDDVLVQLGAAHTVTQTIAPDARQRRLLCEVKTCIDFYFAGKGKIDAQIKVGICDLIFNVKAKDLLDQVDADQLERGLRILHAYEKFPRHNLESKEDVLIQMAMAINEYDRGESEEWAS